MGVAVYEQAPDAETLLLNDTAPVAVSDDQSDEEAEVALSTVDSEFGRTTDPVRMYMREMGGTELLTRAGEVEIAKRIEDGLHEMIQAIAACPATIATILASAEQVAAGELRIDELVDGLNESNAEDDPSASDSATSQDVDADAADTDDVDADDDNGLEAADTNKANEARLKQRATASLSLREWVSCSTKFRVPAPRKAME
jgi:RNA polymerase primary sigma factor